MSEEWISAREALDLVLSKYDNPAAAQMAIYLYSKEENIEAKAEKFLFWNNSGKVEHYDLIVPPYFWEAMVRALLGEKWLGHVVSLRVKDWRIGYFSLSVDGNPYEAKGVSFARADIRAMLPTSPGNTSMPRPNRGRPKGSGGYAADDAILVGKMREYITNHPGATPHFAAGQFADRAVGSAGLERKQRRLADLYRKTYLT